MPSLDEQGRITAILDKADALLARRAEAQATLSVYTRHLFLELIGDPRLNTKCWPKVRISSLIVDRRGGANLEPSDFLKSGFPVLHKGAIKQQGRIEIDQKKKAFVSEAYAEANAKNKVDRRFTVVTLRDLVPAGPTIGLATNLQHAPSDEYLLAQGVYGFIFSSTIEPDYFVALSNFPSFRSELRRYAVGSTQIHIRTPLYTAMEIPLPPLAVQRSFVNQMNVVRHIGALQEKSACQLDSLFVCLQHRAFRGEL